MRKRQFAGSFPTQYISLDGRVIAAIERGEYTAFPVSEGPHSLGITWHVADQFVSFGGVGAMVWNPHSRAVQTHCHPPASYFFTIQGRAFPHSMEEFSNEDLRYDFVQVRALEGDFATDKNTYVAPGPKQ